MHLNIATRFPNKETQRMGVLGEESLKVSRSGVFGVQTWFMSQTKAVRLGHNTEVEAWWTQSIVTFSNKSQLPKHQWLIARISEYLIALTIC